LALGIVVRIHGGEQDKAINAIIGWKGLDMEKPPIITHEINNFDIWYNTKDPFFTELSQKSNIPFNWLAYKTVLSGENKDSVIKPINRYVERLVPPPDLISINNNIVTLRQRNHAEFFLLEKEDGSFYNVDRPWQRQYYNSALDFDADNCYPGTFKFYVPWFIDESVVAYFHPPKEDTPFHTYSSIANYGRVPDDARFVEPHFVPFRFKRVGPHMIDDKFGKIPIGSAMYDIMFYADDIIIERVKEFYEKQSKHN
jgi:hypothetical protein